MKRLFTAFLVPGMITCEDVFSIHDQLLIPKDTVLTDGMISMLSVYGVVNVLVEENPPKKAMESPYLTYSQKVKKSGEFLAFKEVYETEIDTLRDKINLIATKNYKIDIKELYADALHILKSSYSVTHVFDMLHNMREYDDSTYAHSVNVALICNIMATWMKMSEHEIELATTCGLLHDIGKTLIPDSIIKKTDKLSSQEYDLVKKHTVVGYQFLKEHGAPASVCNVALMHHERCDGSGYPLNLQAKDISKYAKIVAIADVYDAMTAARVYRGPLCPFSVIDLFEQEGLQKYDPSFILNFLEKVVNTYISFSCRLNDGRIGTIVYINKHKLGRPMVQCGSEYVDLSTRNDLYIEALV